MDKVTDGEITNEDFMTTVCFSIMGIPRYANIVEIVMNGPALGWGDLINKLTMTKQQYKVTNERPSQLHTAMQALDNWVRKSGKKKKGTYYNCGKEGHFAKECHSKPKKTFKEQANKAMDGGTKFIFTTQLGRSTSNGFDTWILDIGNPDICYRQSRS